MGDEKANPAKVGPLVVKNASDVEAIAREVDFVSAPWTDEGGRAPGGRVRQAQTPVVSNNSAHRATPDVPMMIPEINPGHAAVIAAQRKRLGTHRGFVA